MDSPYGSPAELFIVNKNKMYTARYIGGNAIINIFSYFL